MTLADTIAALDHSKAKRLHFSELILQQPTLFPEVLAFYEQVDTPISCRAAWGLEFICRQDLHAILPHLDAVLVVLPNLHQDAAIRPMAKICEQLCIAYYQKKDTRIRKAITPTIKEQLTAQCFDWLISDQKVAPKAYSMSALWLLGTEFSWIHPELQQLLEKDYAQGSAAYKARARRVLDKICK